MTPLINPPTSYSLQYPIIRTPGQWIIVGVTAAHADERDEIGPYHSFDIHLDADDPTFEFVDPNDWPEIDAKTIESFNFPHRRAGRLSIRRVTDALVVARILDAADRASAWMEVYRRYRAGERFVSVNYCGHFCGIHRMPAAPTSDSTLMKPTEQA